jgi:phage tail-like protein
VSSDSDLYDWSEECADAATNTGLENPQFKRTVDLVILNRAGGTEVIWRLFNAWPKRTSTGDRDGEASEKVIQSTVLEYDYAKRLKQ